MSTNTEIDSITNSIYAPKEKYLLSGNISLPFQLTGMVIAATIMTSASTLPPQTISIGSAVSTDLRANPIRKVKYLSQASIANFSVELQKRSRSLSQEDSQLLRKIMLSKSKLGIIRF